MQKYQKYLSPNEKIIAVFGVGQRYFWLSIIGLILPSLILIGLPKLLDILHHKHALLYILTNKRIILKKGVFSTNVISVPYDKITHIDLREDFVKKMIFGVGDLVIHTPGSLNSPVKIEMFHIDNPLKIKNLIEELTEPSHPLVRRF